MRIQKYLRPHVAYTNRIRPSTRIRFVSGHLKGLVNRACALQRKLYCDVSVYKNIRIRASIRIRIDSVYRNLRMHRAYTADTCGRLSCAVSGFGQFLKSDSREKRVFSYRGFAARVFGRKPTTCWPAADEAPRRTQEKNLWYPQ